jgi:hypothetical protein
MIYGPPELRRLDSIFQHDSVLLMLQSPVLDSIRRNLLNIDDDTGLII